MALLNVLAALALFTGGGAGIVALLSSADERDRGPLNAGWCFLAGSGVAALLLHAPLAIDGRLPKAAFFVVFSILLFLAAWPGQTYIRRGGAARFFGFDLVRGLPMWARIVALILLLLAVSVAFEPLAGWDERAIYGLKARILYHEGSVRVEAFTDKDIVHSQARYPLLIPLLEASLFAVKGSLDGVFLKLLFALFAVSLVMIVTDEASRLDGARAGALWGLLLLTTPFVIGPTEGRGISAYADLPFAAFATGAVVMLGRAFDRPGLSGTMSGLLLGAAIMTKQEGAIWALAIAFAFFLTRWLRASVRPLVLVRQATAVAIPALMFLVLSFAARRWIPPIWTERYGTFLNVEGIRRLGPRPLEIAPFVVREIASASHWSWGWVLVICGLAALRRPKLSEAPFLWRTTAAIVFVSYLCVFIVTPDQVYWHLQTAFARLLLQLFPLAVLILAEQVSASGWLRQGLAALKPSPRLGEPGS